MSCCREHGCKRRSPILLRHGGFSGAWYAVTAYTPTGGGIVSVHTGGKHDVTEQLETICAEAWRQGHAAGLAEAAAAHNG
jgi:hypothetical protein